MLYEIQGTYGSYNTPCTVFVYERLMEKWYCVEGGNNINMTYEDLPDGIDVELVGDLDCIMLSEPINSLEELEIAVEV